MQTEEIVVTVPNVKFVGDPTKLLEAIGKASEKFLAVPKSADGQVGTQKFKYAPYHMVMRCVRPALAEQGVTITQPLSTNDGKAVSTLMVSGHGAIIMSIFEFTGKYEKLTKDGRSFEDPQEFGKNSTYYRRYQLQSFFGLEGDKDADDPDVDVEPVAAKKEVEKKPQPVRVQEAPTNGVKAKPTAAEEVEAIKKDLRQTEERKVDVRSVNSKLSDAMKQLNWKMTDMDEFAASVGLQAPAIKLPDTQKSELYNKLVELGKVAPF